MGILSLINAFRGNPISKMLAENAAEKYAKEKYSHLNLKKEQAYYNFKSGKYHVVVQSSSSIDTNFEIDVDSLGNVTGDSYSSIEFNTWNRIDTEIREKISPILMKQLGDSVEEIRVGLVKESDERELTFDMELDIHNPPAPLEVYVEMFTDDLSYEKGAQIISTIKKIMDEQNIEMERFSFVLIPTKDKSEEGRAVSWQNALTAFDIPVELLDNENSAKAIEEYNEHQ